MCGEPASASVVHHGGRPRARLHSRTLSVTTRRSSHIHTSLSAQQAPTREAEVHAAPRTSAAAIASGLPARRPRASWRPSLSAVTRSPARRSCRDPRVGARPRLPDRHRAQHAGRSRGLSTATLNGLRDVPVGEPVSDRSGGPRGHEGDTDCRRGRGRAARRDARSWRSPHRAAAGAPQAIPAGSRASCVQWDRGGVLPDEGTL